MSKQWVDCWDWESKLSYFSWICNKLVVASLFTGCMRSLLMRPHNVFSTTMARTVCHMYLSISWLDSNKHFDCQKRISHLELLSSTTWALPRNSKCNVKKKFWQPKDSTISPHIHWVGFGSMWEVMWLNICHSQPLNLLCSWSIWHRLLKKDIPHLTISWKY